MQFVLTVLPGTARLDNDGVRALVGKFRFASSDEISEVTGGLEPGMIPPFVTPAYPGLGHLLVDQKVFDIPLIGFNAAHHERSVVMSGSDYAKLVPHAVVARISRPRSELVEGER